MKLHLPKGLFIAVLAACATCSTAWGDVIKYTVGTSANFHEGSWYNETTSQALGANGWYYVCNSTTDPNVSAKYDTGHTLKLSGTGATRDYSFSPLSFNALIVEEGATGYVINPSKIDGRDVQIGRVDETFTSYIHESVTIKAGSSSSITINGKQTWLVDGGDTYTLGGANITNNGTLIIGGKETIDGTETVYNGAVDFSSKKVTGGTIEVRDGSKLKNATLGSGTTLTLASGAQTESITMESGTVLDLSAYTLSSEEATLSADKITLSSGLVVKLKNVTAGSTVALYDQELGDVTFYIDGQKVINSRSDISQSQGSFTFTSIVGNYSDMVWSGGASGDWNTTNATWSSSSAGENLVFENGDSVTFNSTATIVVAEQVSVGGMTVSGKNTTLSLTGNNSCYIAGNVTITDDASLILGTTTNSTGFVRGEIDVQNGTLQFDAKDLTGYNGGTSSTSKITIANDSELILNHSNNETFAGTLVLNGKMKQSDENTPQWDLYGSKAAIVVNDNMQASITGVLVRLRQNDSSITIGTGATLTIGSITNHGDYGNGVLKKSGAGELKITGDIGHGNGKAAIAITMAGGTATLSGGGTTGNIGLNADNTAIQFLAKENTDKTEYTIGKIQTNLDNSQGTRYGSSVTVGEKVVVTATSIINGWGMGSITINGILNSDSIDFATGSNNNTTQNVVQGSGVINTAKLAFGNLGTYNFKDVTINIGSGGIAKSESESNGQWHVNLGDMTLGATADWEFVAPGNTNTKIQLAGTSIGTVFNTEDPAEKGTGHTITVNANLNGTGALVKEGAGILKLNGTNTYSGGTTVNKGELVATKGAALGNGNVTVKGGSIQITEGGATVTVEKLAGSTEAATINKTGAYAHNGGDSIEFLKAKVTFNSAEALSVTNKLTDGSALINAGTGTVTVLNGWNNMSRVEANKGDINIQWQAYQGDMKALVVGAGRTVGVHKSKEVDIDNTDSNYKGTLTITESASFGKGAQLYANLTLKSGTEVALDGSSLYLGNSTLKLETGLTLKLTGDMLSKFNALTPDSGELVLFTGVNTLVLGTGDDQVVYHVGQELAKDNGVKLSDYIKVEGAYACNEYYIGFRDGNVFAGMIVPEPTTATLSLLALAGLCARRRRK